MSFTRKSIFACAPTTTRGEAIQLGSDPKGENFLYTNGKSVIIRNLANPTVATEYTEHSAHATVARYSPSGYYVASGDIHGNVRIWDVTQEEKILKNEVKVIAGKIKDLAWDSESKRLIAVGSGKERYGRAFLYDTGSSVGEISGHTKSVNSVSIRQQRPFRAATGSDDFSVVFLHGVPYKHNLTIRDHAGFVQGVEFSPDGERLVTVGSDKKVFLYDGKTGSKLLCLSDIVATDSHKGSIYAVSWSSDNKQLLTSSGDKTAKIWDIEAQKVVQTFCFSDTIDDQQVGNLWQGEYIISLSLSGDINYLDQKSPSPVKVIKGHQKAITAFTQSKDSTLFTGSYDGRIYAWNTDGSANVVGGTSHTNSVTQLTSQGNKVVSVGMDDTVRTIDVDVKSFSTSVIPTGALPKGVAVTENKIIIATINDIQIICNDKSIFNIKVPSTPGAIAINPASTEIAVGCEDCKVRIYKLNEDKLEEQEDKLSSNRGAITAIAYSPNGSLLAVGDAQGKIYVYDTGSKQVKISEWGFHTARIYSIAWSPDSLHLVSGSLDTNIYVWSVEKPSSRIAIKGAHQVSVSGVTFLDNNTVSSVGQDACLKTWELQHP
ncbi:quinon protein alcohol dehydrogenase-like superfamily [Gigaspora rosea]|uniref:Quinon protein alcohol dehydrogenase-like superfamily n=1 Tax=Gigaspora rosea TaxID=44941 RepID=A0A397VW70_9GLOM|nr:quinon protein alcohol dehydrogenase-like superfamily [Gigaspora rosea]